MANEPITDLTELATVADGDNLYIVDVSDTTDSTAGTSKFIQKSNLVTDLAPTDITGLTASVAELNIMDGVTASTADLNATTNFEETISATTSEVSIATGKTLNIVDNGGLELAGTSVSSTAAELNQLDGVTVGGTSSGDIVDLDTAQTLSSKTLTEPVIGKFTGSSKFPQVYGMNDLGTVGATETVSWANGDRQKMTLDENLTITFSNPIEGQTLTLYMLQDGSGTNTITFADTITWANAATPTWTTTADKMNIAVITYIGTAYFGVGNKFA